MQRDTCPDFVENDIAKQVWILTQHIMFLEATLHLLVARLEHWPPVNNRSPVGIEDTKSAAALVRT